PRSPRIGILYSQDEPATVQEMRKTEAAARVLGVTLQPMVARHPAELERTFAVGIPEGANALILFTHGVAVMNGGRIIEQAARERLPTMYGWRDFVEEGGLMSYGPDIPLMVKKAAGYVDRILKGEKPGDLPFEQPARLEFLVNLKTAKALGLELPPTLLSRADAVIE